MLNFQMAKTIIIIITLKPKSTSAKVVVEKPRSQRNTPEAQRRECYKEKHTNTLSVFERVNKSRVIPVHEGH